MKTLSCLAPAKINLYLDVLSKRPDGFHEVETLMQSVSLADSLSMTFDHVGGDAFESNAGLPNDDTNLCWKAVKTFYAVSKIHRESILISLEKKIPMGAGLGGGSADAAAVLRLMNEYYGSEFSDSELCEMAAAIGSDVPFCVSSHAALAMGRGERIIPIDSKLHFSCVIVMPELSISTPMMYRRIDEFGISAKKKINDAVSALKSSNYSLLLNSMYNIFEIPAFTAYPELRKIKNDILDSGADQALMTGSGSAIYGMFVDENKARISFEVLNKRFRHVYFCRTI